MDSWADYRTTSDTEGAAEHGSKTIRAFESQGGDARLLGFVFKQGELADRFEMVARTSALEGAWDGWHMSEENGQALE